VLAGLPDVNRSSLSSSEAASSSGGRSVLACDPSARVDLRLRVMNGRFEWMVRPEQRDAAGLAMTRGGMAGQFFREPLIATVSHVRKKMSFNYTNLPSWIEQNPIFRKLFLLRKLFLTKTTFAHYSQFAEDISINRFFPKSYKGFFVDVGCFHPKKYNNTWMLYKRGWRGVNIDIDSIKIEGFDIVRPRDKNIHSAVSNKEGQISYWANGFYSLTTSLDDSFANGKTGYIKKTAQCAKLSDILDDTKYKDKEIDFLSVDAEGHDLEVLESLDFDRYNPSLIAVETHRAIFPEILNSKLYRFLIEKDYCLVGWCGLTLLMANKALQQTLANSRC